MSVATEQNPHRLPRTVVPRRYDLRLEPDVATATFSGNESIHVDVVATTTEVVLNAAELHIDRAEVELPDGTRRTAAVRWDEDAERAVLSVDEALPDGQATLHLDFRGILNDKLRGFYRSTFTDHDGTERTLATTQMEATDARRAFPCWDEPDAKAIFAVTLVVPEDMLAVSNAAEVAREPCGDGTVAVRFADTMPMSTYLVAFVVGPLVTTDPVDVDGTPLRVVCPAGKEHLAGFALEVGAFALRYYTEWFGMGYPGDKLDLVAIPDFAFGAMENLGCVTFRERLVLLDEASSTRAERQAVVDVIAHEIAHMWFGDLVTMRWWNGIWLNEAFATFMEMLCTDAFRPDWQRWVDFGLSRSAAFDTDALAATRPIEYPVGSPAEAEGMFDILTYEKGASVVRMLEQHLGADRFRAGIRRYMARHRYGNTETSDLWDALEAETGEPVRRIAESWIFQRGFPEVAVTPGPGGGIVLRQRRFRYDGEDSTERWAVPVVIERGDATTADAGGVPTPTVDRLLLDGDERTLPLPPGGYLKANAGAHGFYRVRYAESLRAALLDRLDSLPPLERYTLADDAWAGVLAGTTGAVAYLELAERFRGDDDPSVWDRVLGGLGQLDRLVEGQPRRRLHERVDALLAPVRDRLGPDPRDTDDDRIRSLRGSLLQASALLGDHGQSIERAAALLERYLVEPGALDPNLSAAALAVTATLGDAVLHDRLVERLRVTENPQDRQRLQFALTRFRDPLCLARTLDLLLSPDVRTQDAPYLVRDALTNRDNGPLAWRFLTAHWSEMEARFPASTVPRMLGGVRAVRDRALATEVEAFVADHPVPQGELQLRQHVERMWVTVALAEREAGRLATALGS